jgi:hypothetical protein
MTVPVNWPRPWLIAVVAASLAACASGDTNRPVGPTQLVNVTLQPARIPPHAQGALLLSAATGCYVEFVGKGPSELVYQFRLGPTQRVPDLPQCLASLRTQPGVTAAEPVP